MHVPRVRLSVERSESESLADLGGEALALGAYAFYLLVLVFGNTYAVSAAVAEPSLVAFGCAFAAVSVALALFDARVHRLFRRYGPLQATVAAACVTGIVPVVNAFLPTGAQLALGVGSSALAGAAAAVAALYLGIAFARLDVHAIMLNTAVALLGAFCLHALADGLLPAEAVCALGAAAPLALLYAMRNRVTDRLPNANMRDATYFHELEVERGGLALKLVLTFAMFGLALGFLANNVRFLFLIDAPAGALPYKLLATFAAAAVLYAAFARVATHDITFNHVFRMFFPLLAAAVLPLALVPQSGAPLVVLLFALVLCVGLTWGFLSSISQQFRLSPVFVFGLGLGALATGLVCLSPILKVGTELCRDIMSAPVFDTIACLFGLVVASSLFPRSVDIHRVVRRSYHVASADAAAGAQAGGAAETPGGRTAPAQDAEAAPNPGAAPAAEGEQHKGRFVRRCELVADTFLLSRRETDVLVLLAKGRNVGYIRENLCISEGTAKTHVHHVYKKLGVHSQQELIALVDSMGEA